MNSIVELGWNSIVYNLPQIQYTCLLSRKRVDVYIDNTNASKTRARKQICFEKYQECVEKI